MDACISTGSAPILVCWQYGSVKAKTKSQSQFFFTNREGREGRKEKKEMLN